MPTPVLRHGPLPALALIAGIAGAAALAFAWTGGWLSPHRIGGSSIANALEQNAGLHPGWRRAHTKGICVSGHFIASGAGAALSRASLFQPGSVPVTGRFSLGGGDPMAGDGRNVFHSMALRFVLPGREEWRMALDHTPIFPVATPADFMALQIASTPDPRTHKPDPALMKAYLAGHPETTAFQDYMKTAPLPSSFANGTYYSINAFRFTDAGGASRIVRWQMEPETPFAALDKASLDARPANFLLEDAQSRLQAGPLKWHMIVVIPKAGDRTDNATIAWPKDRQRVDVGTLVLDHVATEQAGDCRDFNFDPLILPKGVAGSSDPLLAARSAAYSASFRRRAAEGPQPDALTIAATKGATR
jgi:catalase